MNPALTVLAATEDWVVVAKPPRLLVHRTAMASQDRLFALQLVRDQLGRHVFPVFRLDRPASGCLLFALSSEAARALQEAMSAEDAVKTYLAHVRGEWKRGPGRVVSDKPMKDDTGRLKEARTEVECLGAAEEPRSSLLRAFPRTGRYHQVRRHVRDLDHPILGDPAHGDGKVNRWWREARGLTRLGLHCARLDLPLGPGERLRVECPLFEDHAALWADQPWWEVARAAEPLLDLAPLPLLPPFDAPTES